MPTQGTSDAHRFERLMRRHAEGKLSDTQLIAAQEQILGGRARAGRATTAAQEARGEAAGRVDPSTQSRNPFQGRSQGGGFQGPGSQGSGSQRGVPGAGSRGDGSQGAGSQASPPWGGDPTTGQDRRPQGSAEDDESTKRPGIGQFIGFAIAALIFILSRWFGN